MIYTVTDNLSLFLKVTCGHPFQERVTSFKNDTIIIESYMEPAMEGAILTFECLPQYVLIGPNNTTCMGNGEWEPDPTEVECKGMIS